ncbi:hypothetical protein [Microseira sp. BLCC-F43]|jgi:hypothetical protein|uniref:hypothetical protein n=1 Tax=Microseira sp. BLCC-F43 TaxID=3153602 RepID=UPI0035BC1CAC
MRQINFNQANRGGLKLIGIDIWSGLRLIFRVSLKNRRLPTKDMPPFRTRVRSKKPGF